MKNKSNNNIGIFFKEVNLKNKLSIPLTLPDTKVDIKSPECCTCKSPTKRHDQRFRRCHYMDAYSLDETKDYINFPISVTKTLISLNNQAMELLYHRSAGLVRNINILSDSCLWIANDMKTEVVDEPLVELVLKQFKMR